MQCNVGKTDKILRIIAGIVLLGLIPFIGWWGLVGIVPLATALLAWCPAYTLFGINTGNKDQ